MSVQHVLINSNGSTTTNPTLTHYLTNHITNGNEKNVHVQIVKQEQQPSQRYIINRQYVPNSNQTQVREAPSNKFYWLIVEIESNNELNSYALVESKDVLGHPQLETLTTGKLVTVNISNKERRATVVMASSNFFFSFF